MRVTRRAVLAGAAVGGGLLVAWHLVPRSFDNPLSPRPGEIAVDAWLKIASDGVVTVAVPQLEMGQGVTTLLPQVVAMEMGADWRQVAVEPAPVSGAYANIPLAAEWAPLWDPLIPALANDTDDLLLRNWARDKRFTVTARGTTLAAYEAACRDAGAAARAMLAMAAAERWGVPWEQCRAQNGVIYHEENAASFAELAQEAAGFAPPDPPPLKIEPPAEPPPPEGMGASDVEPEYPRLDLPSKVDGSHLFAGDVRLPGMVYAAIRHGPHDKAELLDFDPSLASGQRGLIQLVRGKRWLAAIAENWWAAEQALVRIAPRFAIDRPANSAAIEEALDRALAEGPGIVFVKRGNGIEGYDPDLALRYDIAPGIHATIETTSATARLEDGLLELWLPTQAPEQARRAAAKALGMSVGDVVLYPVSAGGSFDRRLDSQVAIEVALLAREAGRPVQLTWSRGQEMVGSFPRAPAAGLMAAETDESGTIRTLRARVASPPTMREFGNRLFENEVSWAAIDGLEGESDRFAISGLAGPYNVPNLSVEHAPVTVMLPTAPMRGQADGTNCFMRESFIDELAERHQREPMSYRIAMLGQDPEMADCLQRAARLAAWDGGRAGSGQGIACHRMDLGPATGRIAVVAEASAGEGGLRVRRLFAAVNLGRIVNRDLALQQIEGGLIFGLGMALGCATDYANGLPTHRRLAALAMPTLEDCPEILVELIPSVQEPFDPGEIGVPPVAPAVANAFASATGVRLRRLPLLSALP
ncbi:xanthine dehydrogenase family protein molybdopterin-binding subunit [Aurantiacibacter poecillastricola]|uniref:xanthine dehydrogenase family protein molybdopterin-binding subunit n=1 Tax=Aurantiacibacter poecillastricola TaxID=3064385 RepID=UPI00273D9F15|nr:molybdopterin cofactor-binding domain-containing protein [Aurantiacibacter sp. 219JJ12-13]MDP5260128.1 molybdopterin-dependent oxidoreductase [Aurantiacibacter sp. 219JJ12-13]